MTRRLFNLLTALSLLLSVAVVALWVRSYWIADRIKVQRSHLAGPRQYQVIQSLFAAEGSVVFVRDVTRAEYEGDEAITEPLFEPRRQPDGVRRDSASPRGLLDDLNDSDYWPRYGFLADSGGTGFSPRDGTWYTVVFLPCWAAAVTTALLPATRLICWPQRRRRSAARGFPVTHEPTS
jgi:hypothetical protein